VCQNAGNLLLPHAAASPLTAFLQLIALAAQVAFCYEVAWRALSPVQRVDVQHLATFTIGQGQERYRVNEWIRAGVLIGPVLIGIVIRHILSTLRQVRADAQEGFLSLEFAVGEAWR
jgi:hypothetical protein